MPRAPKLADGVDPRRLYRDNLASIEAHLDAGTLPDGRLEALLDWISEWSFLYAGGSFKLTPGEAIELKALAARALAARGGSYERNGIVWRASGSTIQAGLP